MTTQEFAMAQIVLDVLKRDAQSGRGMMTAGEVGRACNISRNSAVKHLKTLIAHDEVRTNWMRGKNGTTWTYYHIITEAEKALGDIPF